MEVPMRTDEIMEAMDNENERVVFVWGLQDGQVFFESMKKGKRSRRSWGVNAVREGSNLEIKEFPLTQPLRHEVYGIFNEQGVVIGIARDRKEYIPEEDAVVKEEDMEILFADKIGDPRSQTEAFWVTQGRSPTLPSTKVGGWLRELRMSRIRTEEEIGELVSRGFAKTTKQTHLRVLRTLLAEEFANKEEEEMGISEWILTVAERRSKERCWAGSTLATVLASTQGALANLPVYRDGMPPVLVKLCPLWKLGMRGAGIKARGTIPEQALVATREIILEAIDLEPIPEVKAALEIGWLTAGRGGDVVKLRSKDLVEIPNGTRVRFVVGKTATSQPYTVSTARLSPSARRYVAARQKAGGETGWLFPGVLGTQIKDALRRVDIRLEQRSLRRGALQFLASTGMSDTQLMAYSQHRSLETLRRYLNFGWLSGEGAERAQRASGLGLSAG